VSIGRRFVSDNGQVLLLAFDTATPAVTVALRGDEGVLAEHTEIDARRHGELLAPGIEKVLADAGCSRTDLTGVVVGVGPGPFTGLRVGLMTARALGDALDIPVYGVCTLDILAAAVTAALRDPAADPAAALGALNPTVPRIDPHHADPQNTATAGAGSPTGPATAAARANGTGTEEAPAGDGARRGVAGDLRAGDVDVSATSAAGDGAQRGGTGGLSDDEVRANVASAVTARGAQRGVTGDLRAGDVDASAAWAAGDGAQRGGTGGLSDDEIRANVASAVAAHGARRGETVVLRAGDVDADAVSVLAAAAAAAAAAAGGRFAVATDARRREVYWAIYDLTGRRETDPSVDRPADIAERLAGLAVAGQGPLLYPEQFPYALSPALPSAAVLAELTVRRLREAPEALLPLEPLYLRRPDAVEPGARKSVTPA
jgi:tRNA A37 threonylcarbamoyladenosine modification protein TsaB